MSQSFLNKFIQKKWWLAIVLPVWVFVSFVLAQVMVTGAIQMFSLDLREVNQAVLTTVFGAIIYSLTLLIVIGVPRLIKKHATTLDELGLRVKNWLDLSYILLVPIVFLLAYLPLSSLLSYIATSLSLIDPNAAQDTGFAHLTQPYEFVLAFLMLVIVAPVAEEIIFRGYLFGKLRAYIPTWLAVILTSVLFGLVHGSVGVGLDVFALSIVLCVLRVVSKTLWPSIALHMLKNAVAFYFLFINPTFLGTLGG